MILGNSDSVNNEVLLFM